MDIDYTGLTTAFQDANDFGHSYWLNTETGDVLMIDDWSEEQARELDSPYDASDPTIRLAWCVLWQDGEIESEDPDKSVQEQNQVNTVMDFIVRVPQADTREDYNLMIEFAATVPDPHLCELLEVALDGRGAFRRFKDVLLRYPDERERWFEFRDSALHREIDAWLESVGLLEESDED